MNTGRTDVPASALSGTRLALATLCVAAFFAAMNFVVASPFHADVADDLDTTVPLLGQLATVMLLISAALGLFVGPLADRYGIRWLLTLGMGAISLNLLGTAATPSYPMLVPLAVVGALGDALVFGLAFPLDSTIFSAEARRRAIEMIHGVVECCSSAGRAGPDDNRWVQWMADGHRNCQYVGCGGNLDGDRRTPRRRQATKHAIAFTSTV